jgi:H+/Cl- antiporter ClcA
MDDFQEQMRSTKRFNFSLLLQAVLVGLFAGLIISLFRITVDFLLGKVGPQYSHVASPGGVFVIIAIMSLIGLACGFLTKLDPHVGSSGIPQVAAQLAGKLEMNWKKVLPLKFVTCVMTLGSGLTMGREGPSVQIGGVVGQGVAEVCKCPKSEQRYLLSAGAAAGLATAFSAPIAGVLFSMETLHQNFSKQALICCMAAALTGDYVAAQFFGIQPIFHFDHLATIELKYYWFLLILGIVMGFSGALFNVALIGAKDWHTRMDEKHNVPWWVWSVVPFVLTAIVCLIEPALFGSGQSMVSYAADVSASPTLAVIILFYFIKVALLAMCFGSGLPGGCFQPLLGLGALAGDITAQFGVLAGAIPPDYILPIALIAMAGQFASAIRAPLTGLLLIAEITQLSSLLLPIGIVTLVSHVTAQMLGVKPFYASLQERIAPDKNYCSITTGNELVEYCVEDNSPVDGMTVGEVNWPADFLIVSVRRGDQEAITTPSLQLKAGDYIIGYQPEASAAWNDEQIRGLVQEQQRFG